MEQLIRGLQAGEAGAYERLLQDYGDRLVRFARRHVGDAEAEDLVQEVFLRVHRAIGSYDPSGSFAAWLFTIAHRLCLDQRRSRTPLKRAGPLDEDVADRRTTTGPDDGLRDALAKAVANLPPEQKQVFLLREEGDLSFQEIADVMKCPLNTALGRMHYAMENLRKSLKAYQA